MATLEELVVQIKVDSGNLKASFDSAQKSIKDLGDASDNAGKKVQAFDAQFKGADGKWHNYGSSGKDALKGIGDAADDAANKTKQFGDETENAGTKSKNSLTTLIPSWQAVGAAAAAAGAAIVAGVGIAAKSYMDFEQTSVNAASVTGLTGQAYQDALTNIKAVSLELGSSTTFSASEAANAMYDLASAGFDVSNMAKSDLQPILDIAAGTQSDLTFTTKTVTDAISQFGLTTADSGRIADVYATAISESKATMESLSTAMVYAGPVSEGFGRSLEETTAVIARLNDAGFKGEQAGTAFRTAMLSLVDPSKEAVGALGLLGIEIEDINPTTHTYAEILGTLSEHGMTVADATQIFGKETAAAMTALVGQTFAVEDLTTSLHDCTGAAEDLAAKQRDTLAGSWDELKGSIEGIVLSLGSKLAPSLRSTAEYVTGLTPRIQKMIDEMGKWGNSPSFAIIKEFAGSALKNLQQMLGGSLKVVQDFSGSGGLGRLAEAAKVTLQGMVKFSNFLRDIGVYKSLGNTLEGLIRVFLWVVDAISRVIIAVRDIYTAFKTAYQQISTSTAGIRSVVSAAFESVRNVINTVINTIKSIIGAGWNAIRGNTDSSMNGIRNTVNTAWNALRTVVSTAINAIRTVVTTGWNGIRTVVIGAGTAIQSAITGSWNNIRNAITTAMNTIRSVITAAWNTIRSAAVVAISGIASAVSTGWNSIRNAISTAMANISKGVSTGWSTIRTTFSSSLSGIVSTISNMGGSFYSAAASLTQKAIDGLNSKLSSLRSAYNSVMSYLSGGSSSSGSSGSSSGSSSRTTSTGAPYAIASPTTIRQAASRGTLLKGAVEVHDTGGVAGYSGLHYMQKGELAIPKQYNWNAAVISPIVRALSSKISSPAQSSGNGVKKVVVTINNKASDVTNLNKTIIKAAKTGTTARYI